MIDTKTVEKIAPDYWRHSQLSIVRHYGRCSINGTSYFLDPVTDCLVRADVWRRELRDQKIARQVAKAEKKKWLDMAQGKLW